jgi:hypothetical protein
MHGDDIQSTALDYGFSSQQVLTRCIGSRFGVTPAKLRNRPEGLGRLFPRIRIEEGADEMRLVPDYSWRNGGAVDVLMERVLTKDAVAFVARAVEGPLSVAEVPEQIKENMISIGALREDGAVLRVNAPVVTAEDRARLHEAADILAGDLAARIVREADRKMLRDHPRVRGGDDLSRYVHFLTGPVTLGWQGHQMLMRRKRIPSRAENTDASGRWFLLRFYEPTEQEYESRPYGVGGTISGEQWALSTSCASLEGNALERLIGVGRGVSEDELQLRDEMVSVLVDYLGGYCATPRNGATRIKRLAEQLQLVERSKPTAVVIGFDEFDAPRAFMAAVYGAMVSWWEENEKRIDEVLSETTASKLGIPHKRLYHEAWQSVVAETGITLREEGYLVDLSTLPNGAVNAFWDIRLDLQGSCLEGA